MSVVYLQLGSNLGDRKYLLRRALAEIEFFLGNIINKSNIYESSPWGLDEQLYYLNQIVLVETSYTANEVLANILNIETLIGRKRNNKWGARLIDIDIIFYDNQIINTPALCVPHKYMHERNFVLVPLSEIASNYIHPIYNKTVGILLQECKDSGKVTKYEI